VLVIGMIEDREGHANIEEIAAVPGMDLLHIGPGDLAQDMGHIGRAAHPEVQAAVDDIIARTQAAGKPVGLGGIRVDDVAGIQRAHAAGVRFFTLSFAQMAVLGAQQLLGQLRGATAEGVPGALH
jgi:4-hydroxy-2-oxoheptanedioate aldolase